jgi:hypothetical protein
LSNDRDMLEIAVLLSSVRWPSTGATLTDGRYSQPLRQGSLVTGFYKVSSVPSPLGRRDAVKAMAVADRLEVASCTSADILRDTDQRPACEVSRASILPDLRSSILMSCVSKACWTVADTSTSLVIAGPSRITDIVWHAMRWRCTETILQLLVVAFPGDLPCCCHAGLDSKLIFMCSSRRMRRTLVRPSAPLHPPLT